ncbi:MAG: ParA family protein [archaeon]
MRKICVINQKGGVGKTTTTLNIAAGLSRHGRRVLVIDFDAQGNIGHCLNIEGEKDIYHLISENAEIQECTKRLGENLHIIPSRETLTKTEVLIAQQENREFILKEKLADLKGYDYVLIDCPPSLGLLNQNAMLFAQEAFIPVTTDHLGYDALVKMTKVIETINKTFRHNIRITKVIPTMFDQRINTCKVHLDKISSLLYEATTIPVRVNSKLKEAPLEGKSIFSYAPQSTGAQDYMKITRTIIDEEQRVLAGYVEGPEENLVPLNSPEVMEEFKKKNEPIKV